MTKKPLTKLIFVDDDADILTVAKFCLEKIAGANIKYLTSGEEAVKETLTFQPDLVLCDVMMPGMDGITVLQTLKMMPNASHIPVVFFTAKAQKEEIARYFTLGVLDVITKPFDPMTLATTVEKIWDKYQEAQSKQ